MTERRILDRGGMSSTDSGVITSSGWVSFKKKNEHSSWLKTTIFKSKCRSGLINLSCLKSHNNTLNKSKSYQFHNRWSIGEIQILCHFTANMLGHLIPSGTNVSSPQWWQQKQWRKPHWEVLCPRFLPLGESLSDQVQLSDTAEVRAERHRKSL